MTKRSYVVGLVALVFCVSACSSGGGKQSASTTSARHVSTTPSVLRHVSLVGCHCTPGLRLSFDYPQSLHVYPIHVDEHYVQIVGYVSNRNLRNPCRTLPSGGECGYPLDSLSDGGVLVQWSFAVPAGGIDIPLREAPGTQTVVDGRPAKVASQSGASACPPLGGVRIVTAVIGLGGSQTLDMSACLGRGALSEESAVLAMLRSVRISNA
jgi:hypothetical protein